MTPPTATTGMMPPPVTTGMMPPVTTGMMPPVMTEAAARSVLADLSAGFRTRDPAAVLGLFSTDPTATYLGSEVGEQATGGPALSLLLTALIGRDAVYTFDFPYVSWGAAGPAGAVWIVGEGRGTETTPERDTESFPYRVSGVLVWEDAAWRWVLLVGSEPTSPAG